MVLLLCATQSMEKLPSRARPQVAKALQLPAYLQDFGAALPAQRAQDQPPFLGQSSLADSLQPQSAHGFVVVVLPGEHFTVRVVSVRRHRYLFPTNQSPKVCQNYIFDYPLKPIKPATSYSTCHFETETPQKIKARVESYRVRQKLHFSTSNLLFFGTRALP